METFVSVKEMAKNAQLEGLLDVFLAPKNL